MESHNRRGVVMKRLSSTIRSRGTLIVGDFPMPPQPVERLSPVVLWVLIVAAVLTCAALLMVPAQPSVGMWP